MSILKQYFAVVHLSIRIQKMSIFVFCMVYCPSWHFQIKTLRNNKNIVYKQTNQKKQSRKFHFLVQNGTVLSGVSETDYFRLDPVDLIEQRECGRRHQAKQCLHSIDSGQHGHQFHHSGSFEFEKRLTECFTRIVASTKKFVTSIQLLFQTFCKNTSITEAKV